MPSINSYLHTSNMKRIFLYICIASILGSCFHMSCKRTEMEIDKKNMIFDLKDPDLYFTAIKVFSFDSGDPQHQSLLYELTFNDSSPKMNEIHLFTDSVGFERKGDVTQIKSEKYLRFQMYCKKDNQTIGHRFWFGPNDCEGEKCVIKSNCP